MLVAARACVVCAVLVVVGGAGVTPVEKVTSLLTQIEKQIQADGAKEAAQYDKYACFCKEQADEKQYAIEKSAKKIEHLDAVIAKLEADIADLDSDISSLSEHITGLEDLIKGAKEVRAQQRERFLGHDADITAAIEATAGAIAALKQSKGAITGDAKLNFMQLQAMAVGILGSSPRALTTLAQASEPGKPHAVQYQSNDIIATLQGLLVKFKENKKELDNAEFEQQAASDKKVLGLSNEKKFAEQDKAEKEQVVEDKTEELEANKGDWTSESAQKKADEEFRSVLAEECENKAGEWDQRSKTRAGELTAIAEAIQTLKSGVAPNYQANKKLVGLQRGHAVAKGGTGHWVFVEDTLKRKSFLQLPVHRSKSDATARAIQSLLQAAGRTGSPVLSAAVMKVQLQADHFVKVRSLLKDLIQRLEDDAESEATQKGMCDKQMKAAIDKRDSEQGTIEDKTAAISGRKAEVAQLTAEIAQLKAEVAANMKALSEATELRATEKADNEKTIEDAGAGKEAVTFALTILEQFYGSALLQQMRYVPPNADREGKTVGDRAPEVFEGEYHGNQAESKGIIGILNVILSDFERTETKVQEDEDAAEEEFQQFKTDTEEDNTLKNEDVTAKETQVTDKNDEIVTLKDEKISATKSHGLALDELEKLQSMCVEGEETWEQRKAAREKEVAALKEALNILEEWQG